MKRIATLAITIACAVALGSPPARGAPDPAKGKRLMAEHGCDACHARRMNGDPAAIFLRKGRKVASLAQLKSQVAACNSGFGTGLFPEEEDDIVAYLNREYYKFK